MAITAQSDVHKTNQVGATALGIAFQATPLLAAPNIAVQVPGKLTDAGSAVVEWPVFSTDVSGITQDAVTDNRTGVTPSKLSLTSYSETAQVKTISVDADKFAWADASEDSNAHLALIIGREFGATLQHRMIEQVLDGVNGTDLELDVTSETTTTLTVDYILEALTVWGDKASEMSDLALFCTTSQFVDLAQSSDYKSLAAAARGDLASAKRSGHSVGSVHGIPIYLCDNSQLTNATPDPDEYTALLAAAGAWYYYVADVPETEVIGHAGSTVRTFDTHFRYASTLARHSPRRVVKIITQ